MLKIIETCPLGSTCEKAVDGAIHRCAWYVEVQGMNPQTGEPVNDKKCAITWMPLLQIEAAMTNRGQTEAICSMRDESLKRQDEAIQRITEASNGKKAITN